MDNHKVIASPNIDEIFEIDNEIRIKTGRTISANISISKIQNGGQQC